LNDGNLTNIVIESAQEPLVVIFDLGSDKPISRLVVYSRQTDWNNNGLTGCSFYANSEAQGKFTGYCNGNGMEKAAWATGVSAVDKSNTVWTVDTGVLSAPITARYIGIVADYGYGGTYNPAAISEVEIYGPAPLKSWDFVKDFSTTTSQVTDSQGNVVWEYRAGAWNSLPSQTSFYSSFGSWLTPPAWEGNTGPQSRIGSGYLRACTPGGGDQFPFLTWKSSISGHVTVNLSVSNPTGAYQVEVFKNDTPLVSEGGLSTTFNYSDTLAVAVGDRITLMFGAWGNYPEANVSFKVDQIAEPSAEAPAFSPAGEYIVGPTPITITCATAEADIYYTTDGSTPSLSSTHYTTSVVVDKGTTLSAIASVSGGNPSPVTSVTYKYYDTQIPVFMPSGKNISGPTPITISSATVGAAIYYTTDGTTPTAESTPYTGPVTVNAGTVLQAIALAPNHNLSLVKSMTYVVPASYSRPETISAGIVTVDGSLSDWANATWAPLDKVYDGTPSDITTAEYAAKWQAGKVYVAVRVEDTDHFFTDTWTQWNVHDSIEVYIHTNNDGPLPYAKSTSAQQYVFGFKNSDPTKLWTSIGGTGANYDVPDDGSFDGVFKVAGTISGNWLYYEIELTPFEYFGFYQDGSMSANIPATLKANDVIGLDVCALGHSATAYTGMKSENSMTGKSNDWSQFGLHKLVIISGDANSDGAVDVGDLGILAANYGGTDKTWSQGDFNGDGAVDVGDLGILAAHYGEGSNSSQNFTADYAKAFSTTVTEEGNNDEINSSVCSALGLPLIAGFALMALMLIKLDE
jgi:hypothetical protein